MKRKFLLFGLVTAIAASMSSCLKTEENRDEEMIAKNETDIQAFISKDVQGTEAQRDSSGYYYINRVPNPSGQKAQDGDAATIKFNGYLLDGTKVVSYKDDSSFTFPVGVYRAIGVTSMELAVRKMRVGEKFTILSPFYLAFENRSDYNNIPAYAPMRFEIQMLKTRTESQQIDDFIAKKQFVVSERSTDNLVIIRTNTVIGDTLGTGKSVSVKYIGKLLNDTKFDEGVYPMTTGTNSAIPGFDRAVRRMRKGEKAIVVFPSKLGYKSTGSGDKIGPYAPLQFELEIQ